MATIKIRGRLEPVTVSDDQAKKVKARKFGLGVPAALPNELVDLGDWSGEYGRIVEIEMPKSVERKDAFEEDRRRHNAETAKWLAMAPKVKAQTVGWFKILYSTRMGDFKADPPKETLDKVIALHEKLYTENPKLLPMRIGSEEYGDLLPPRRGAKIAERMRVPREEVDPLAF